MFLSVFYLQIRKAVKAEPPFLAWPGRQKIPYLVALTLAGILCLVLMAECPSPDLGDNPPDPCFEIG